MKAISKAELLGRNIDLLKVPIFGSQSQYALVNFGNWPLSEGGGYLNVFEGELDIVGLNAVGFEILVQLRVCGSFLCGCWLKGQAAG